MQCPTSTTLRLSSTTETKEHVNVVKVSKLFVTSLITPKLTVMRDQHDCSFFSMSPPVIIVTISIVTKFAHSSHEIGRRKSDHNNIPIYRATLGG